MVGQGAGRRTITRDSAESLYGSYSAKLVASNYVVIRRFWYHDRIQRETEPNDCIGLGLFFNSTNCVFRIATAPLDNHGKNLAAGWQKFTHTVTLSSQSDQIFLDIDGITLSMQI